VREPDVPEALQPWARRLGVFRIRRVAMVAAADVALALGLFALSGALGVHLGLGAPPVGLDSPIPWFFALSAPIAMAASRGYELHARLPGAELSRFGRLLLACTVAAWVTVVLTALMGEERPVGQILVVSQLLPVLAAAARLLVEAFGPLAPERIVVVGSGLVASRVGELARRAGRGFELVGHVDDALSAGRMAAPLLGPIEDLPDLLERHRIDRVIVAFSEREDRELMAAVRACDDHAVDVDIVPRLFEFTGLEPAVSALGDIPLVHVRARQTRVFGRVAKRLFDIVVSALLLVILSPVLAAIALAVKLEDRGRVLYRQRRIGRCGMPFDILKFRSMVPRADAIGMARIERAGSVAEAVAALKQERDPRITRVGDFIRRTSLDELPQLVNVVKGDMSLVGPRPLRPFEVEALNAWQLVRQKVRPGITGLWQVLGRSDIAWDDRIALDYAYVRQWSPVQDLRILAETVPVVLHGGGAR
jgi:exopolysaccharide biosynthesis polyprenyl glycosylphosphotransferase